MKAKHFLLLLVTAAAVFALVSLVDRRDDTASAAAGGARLFPELAGEVNEVAALRIEGQDGAFTLARGESGWGIREKAGYPVDFGKVRQILLQLADARRVEEKTSMPERYELLGVQEPDAEGARSTRLVALDSEDRELASLIVGDARIAKGSGMLTPGASGTAYYVRPSDEAAAWLVSGDLRVDGSQSAWLDKDILDLQTSRVRSVEIEHADGERVLVQRAEKAQPNFDVSPIPEGRSLRYASIGNTVAGALARLTMEDVVPSAEVGFDDPPLARLVFRTFDGLRVKVTAHEQDEKLYARFEADYEEPIVALADPLPGPLAGEEDAAEEGGEAAEGGEGDELAGEGEPAVDTGPSPEEIREEAREITERTAAWTYVLPSWKRSNFVKRMEDLLNEPPSEDGAGAAEDELGFEGFDPYDLEGLIGEGTAPSTADDEVEPLPEEPGSATGGEGPGDPADAGGAGGGGDAPAGEAGDGAQATGATDDATGSDGPEPRPEEGGGDAGDEAGSSGDAEGSGEDGEGAGEASGGDDDEEELPVDGPAGGGR